MKRLKNSPIVEIDTKEDADQVSVEFLLFSTTKLSPIKVIYKNHPEGCQRVHDGQEEFIKNKNYIELCSDDLESVLSSMRVLSHLSITISEESSLNKTDVTFLKHLKRILDLRPSSLIVNDFTLTLRSISSMPNALSVVVSCRSDIFKTLKLNAMNDHDKCVFEKTLPIDNSLQNVYADDQLVMLENLVNGELHDFYGTTKLFTYILAFSDEYPIDKSLIQESFEVTGKCCQSSNLGADQVTVKNTFSSNTTLSDFPTRHSESL